MKKYFSIPLHALIGLTVFFIAANLARFVAYDAQNWYRGYYWKKAQAEYERPFREDKIGGQTPEQTWEMFITALEAGDVEKASGYFHVSERDKLTTIISDIQKDNKLSEFISNYKGYFNSSERVVVRDNEMQYKYKQHKIAGPNKVVYPDGRTEIKQFPARDYEGDIHFLKNMNNVWKIYSL